jgi:hypothetical protein
MDYGTDFKLKDDDVVFTPEGDLELVEGPACVAQDIDQTLKIVPGRLPWAPEAGSTLLLMLNGAGLDSAAVIDELERAAVNDPRTDPLTVQARQKEDKLFRLNFTPLGAVQPEVLEYDLNKEGSGV